MGCQQFVTLSVTHSWRFVATDISVMFQDTNLRLCTVVHLTHPLQNMSKSYLEWFPQDKNPHSGSFLCQITKLACPCPMFFVQDLRLRKTFPFMMPLKLDYFLLTYFVFLTYHAKFLVSTFKNA